MASKTRKTTTTYKKSLPWGRVLVSVKVPNSYPPIARAIAAAMSAGYESIDEATTVTHVFEAAIMDGLVGLEKEWLGTSSLDEALSEVPAEAEQFPESTPVMLALVKALGGGAP